MKALTIKQPWAWAIATGHKDIENRTWATAYRGPLAIHAGKSWDTEGMRACREHLEDLGAVKRGEPVGERHLLAAGAIVAVVDLVGICTDLRCRCSGWAVLAQKHWQLRNARPLADPIPYRGAQGLWEVDLPGYELVDRERARGRVR